MADSEEEDGQDSQEAVPDRDIARRGQTLQASRQEQQKRQAKLGAKLRYVCSVAWLIS